MKPLLVLIVSFIIASAFVWMSAGKPDFTHAGRVAMSVMMLFTAIGHFKLVDGMGQMLPAWFPAKRFVVLLTGFIELAAAIGLHIPGMRTITGWLLILFFVLIPPANISAARRRLNYETGLDDGPGPRYLWFRIPMQVLLVVWVYLTAIGNP